MTIQLGVEVKDMVTGFTGVVTGLVQYLTDCTQALVVPRVSKDGAYREGQWIDIIRLKPTGRRRIGFVEERKSKAKSPGFDKSPSVRI